MRRHGEVIGVDHVHPGGTRRVRRSPSSRSSRRSPIRQPSPSTTPDSCRRSNSATRTRRVAGTPDGHERHPRTDQLEPRRASRGARGHRRKAAALCGADSGHVLLWRDGAWRIEAIEGRDPSVWIGVEVPFIEVNRRARDDHAPVFVDDFRRRDRRHRIGGRLARSDSTSFATVALRPGRRVDRQPLPDSHRGPAVRSQARPDPAGVRRPGRDRVANAKLFNDLDAALERQTAMTDVLDAVSTARFDLQPVFDRIVEHASRLCHDSSDMSSSADADVRPAANSATDRTRRLTPSLQIDESAVRRGRPIANHGDPRPPVGPLNRPRPGPVPPDLYPFTRGPGDMRGASAPDTADGATRRRESVRLPGCSTAIRRGGYTDAEIELLQTFAGQDDHRRSSNARLLREIEQRNTELSESLELQTANVGDPAADQRQPRQPRRGVPRHHRPRPRATMCDNADYRGLSGSGRATSSCKSWPYNVESANEIASRPASFRCRSIR